MSPMPEFRFLSLALILLASVVSCGEADRSIENSEADASGAQPPTVALIMKSLANEFFVTMADGATTHQAAHSDQYRLIVNGIKNEVDLTQQVALIDQMIASEVDAIVISPADSKAVVPALARAHAKGIVVINIDNRLDRETLAEYGLAIPFVGPDNFQGARLVGQYLASHLSPGQEVAILEGVPSAFNSRRRTAGFDTAMQDAGMNVVAKQSAQWDQTLAVTITSALLVQHPNLAAILCANDNMALGAVAAVTRAGKAEQIEIIGFDNISAVQKLIKEGTVLATIDQHAAQLATFGIEHALDSLATTKSVSDKVTPADLITRDLIN